MIKYLVVALMLWTSVVWGEEGFTWIEDMSDAYIYFKNGTDNTNIMLVENPSIVFNIENKEVLKITKDGKFYANGKLMIEKDRRIYELFKKFLENANR